MAVPTVNDFRGEFPEFASVQDTVIEQCIKRALRFHDITQEGTLYAAAHLHSLDQEKAGVDGTIDSKGKVDGGAGVVSQEAVGSRSVAYMNGAGDDERRVFWQRTPYGREFLKIEERNPLQAFGFFAAR